MALRASVVNGKRIYNVTQGKTLPEFAAERKWGRALQKDQEYRRRVELIQDFDFPAASQCVRMSPDGQYIAACGVYPPQAKVFDVRELSMKFERHMDAEVVDFALLGDDWRKMVFLQTDRWVEVHAAYGRHHRTRIPQFGRTMAFHAPTAECLIGTSSSEIYRLSLEEGRFMAPFQSRSPSVNALHVSGGTGLVAAGGEDGAVEIWDPRTRECAGRVVLPDPDVPSDGGKDVTAVQFDPSGLYMGVGSGDSRCLLYDLRSSHPLRVKEHQNDLPVQSVRFHRGTDQVISADAKVIKIWERDTGKAFTTIETAADVNDVALVADSTSPESQDSGLLLVAGEQPKVMAYYVPELGRAPSWCAFLDSLTEELEEGGSNEAGGEIFDDYKFVTRDELTQLGLAHLIGTPMLRAYMHGFFMDARLYQRVRSVVDPDAFQRWRKRRVREKLDEKKGKRIVRESQLPKVNKELAAKLIRRNQAGDAEGDAPTAAEGGGTDGQAAAAPSILHDSRFSALFTDPAFEIDPEAAEFIRVRGRARGRPGAEAEEEKEEKAHEGGSAHHGAYNHEREDEGLSRFPNDSPSRGKGKTQTPAKRTQVPMTLAAQLVDREAARAGEEAEAESRQRRVRVVPGGGREVTFVPSKRGRRDEMDDDQKRKKPRKSRGTQGKGKRGRK